MAAASSSASRAARGLAFTSLSTSSSSYSSSSSALLLPDDLPANCRVLERCVSPHPLDHASAGSSSITTLLLATPQACWVRVYNHSNTNSNDNDCGYTLHASFRVASTFAWTQQQPVRSSSRSEPQQHHHQNHRRLLCWTSFSSNNKHLVLCVLTDVSSLAIYDVYPSRRYSQDASEQQQRTNDHEWLVTLPFDCDSIHAMATTKEDGAGAEGLLLQRSMDLSEIMMNMNTTVEEEDVNVAMQEQDDGSSNNNRILPSPANTNQLWSQQQQQTSQQQPLVASAMPSLFTLSHPLEEVLPVLLLPPAAGATTTTTTTTKTNKNASIFMDPTTTSMQTYVSDPMEVVVWTGMAEWSTHCESSSSSSNSSNHTQQQAQQQQQLLLVVTYHTRFQRHSIWALQPAPPPPATMPLYQQTAHQRLLLQQQQQSTTASTTTRYHHKHTEAFFLSQQPTMSWDDDEPMVMATATTTTPLLAATAAGAASQSHHKATRQEALADALLGVRKTPRLSMEAPSSYTTTTAGGNAGGLGPRNHHHHHHHGPSRPTSTTAAARPSDGLLLSPLPHSQTETTTTSSSSSWLHSQGNNHTNTLFPDASTAAAAASSVFGPMAPKVALQCLYEQQSSSGSTHHPVATQIHLVANKQGSGSLTLVLLQPIQQECNSSINDNDHGRVEEDAETNDNDENTLHVLQWFQLVPTKKDKMTTLQVIPMTTATETLCWSAQPVCVAPIPAVFGPNSSSSSSMATDLLVISQDHRLLLLRENQTIVEYTFASDNNSLVLPKRLSESVHNRVTLETTTLDGTTTTTTTTTHCCGRLKLQPTSILAETVLAALDCALASTSATTVDSIDGCLLALKLRGDVCRLEQHLVTKCADQALLCTDCGWLACAAVLLTMIQIDFFREIIAFESTTRGAVLKRPQNNSAWETLLQSDYHREKGKKVVFPGGVLENVDDNKHAVDMLTMAIQELQRIECCAAVHCPALEQPLSPCLFDTLHMVMEECKLSTSCHGSVPVIASILVTIFSLFSNENIATNKFFEYYLQETVEPGRIVTFTQYQGKGVSKRLLTKFASPPSFFRWVDGVLSGRQEELFFDKIGLDGINASCKKMRAVYRVFSILRASESSESDFDVVKVLLEEGFKEPQSIREELPPGIALPCLEVLYRCRSNPALVDLGEWSADAWTLVGREDLARNTVGELTKYNSVPVSSGNDDRFVDEDGDGLVSLEKSSAVLFPDNRVHEAARLLRSSRPLFLRVNRTVETSDHDYERLKQKKLMLLGRRALSLPVGRGMLSIGSLIPLAAEPLPIPELILKGRVPPTNTSLALDETECPADMRVWPEFHNGVSAGLRIGGAEESDVKISRTWIVYNRPPPVAQPQTPPDGEDAAQQQQLQQSQRKIHAHGGLLLALGLRGHLTALEMSDVYDYLTKGQVTTTVGILLGLAANKRGSCDIAVSKMLCLHIPSLIPSHFSAIDVASTVQAAAITGTGLLFSMSSNRMITEFLLNEIGKRPESETTASDRESYTLACGLSLGIINLGIGNRDSGHDRAQGLADLRIEDRLNAYIKGGVDMDEQKRSREINDRFSVLSAAPNGDNERCSTVYEGDQINTDVTAPAATLALALMYMKTGNTTVASMLTLPDTHFTLEFIRPDFLTLRVMAKTLILWNEVNPTTWIAQQIPEVVSSAYLDIRASAKRAMDGIHGKGRGGNQSTPEYDRRSIRQIYVHVIAGACFGMGLRYAGTGDERAKAAIMERVLELQTLMECKDLISAASRPDLSILETCLGCTAISLAMVLAGTGDLDALKLFKILRWRCEEDSSYGCHMIYGMAIGLLFLGGGSSTLSREPEAIAALVTAFYPRFPATTSDNQYHLQANRHLYALAVVRKELRAVDVDTNETVSVPVEIRFTDSSCAPVQTSVPCLLRNSDQTIKELVVTSDNYYPLKVHVHGDCEESLLFYVKKKKPLESETDQDVLTSTTKDCTTSNTTAAPTSFLHSFVDHVHTFPLDSLMIADCQNKAMEEAVGLYLSLVHGKPSLRTFWDLKLIRSYYERRILQRATSTTTESKADNDENDLSLFLLNPQLLLSALFERTERLLLANNDDTIDDTNVVSKYVSLLYESN